MTDPTDEHVRALMGPSVDSLRGRGHTRSRSGRSPRPLDGREPTVQGIDRKKPTPYYLEVTLAELGTENALFVGDSWVDVEAAEAAGIDVAFIRRSHREGYELHREPTYEIEGVDALSRLV